MKGWLLLVAVFLLWPGFSSQNACEEPDEIDFGEIVSTEKAKYLENDRVQYRCNPSYVLEGSEWIQCNGQEWTPHPPKCLAPCSITRQQLAAKKLFVFGNQRKAQLIRSNRSLQFQCNEGYVLMVPSVRKCVDGYMDLPLCISERGKNCSGPPRTENGDIITLSEKQYGSGSSVEFRCQKYYAMEGQNRSFCDNGTWTKVPICLDPCIIPRTELESQKIEVKEEIDAPENVFVQHGHSVELTCRRGYVLAANSSQSAFVIPCHGTPPEIPKCKVSSWRRSDDRKEEHEEHETVRKPPSAAPPPGPSVSKEREKEGEKEKAWRTDKEREALRHTKNETDDEGWTTVRR